MSATSRFGILVLLSFRNLFSHWIKTLIVGAIMAFGTVIVVTGTALNDSIERAMAEGITGSIAGHLQVYSAKAKDDLALFGGMFMGAEDVGRIDDYSAVRDTIAKIDGVKAVLPMGIDMATTTSQGELERSLAALRVAVRDGDASVVPALKTQINEILAQLLDELKTSAKISSDKKNVEGQVLVERAMSDEFWAEYDADPLAALEYLDTKVAPLTEEGRMLYFRYVGTDISMFQDNFERFEIVEGEVVPAGRRGFMFNKKFREDWVKHFVARTFDKIHNEVTAAGKTIADDPALQANVRQMSKQYRRITYQLTPTQSKELESTLRTLLGDDAASIDELLGSFLTVTDENLEARYAFFYEHVAPKIDLYDVDVGDTVTLRAFTRSGFLKSVNVKVYGVFQFRGLETSDIAGGHNVVDLLTFREMYGLMTDEKKKELDGIRAEIGLEEVDAANAEAALFGGDDAAVEETVEETAGFDEFAGVDLASERERMAATVEASFDKETQDRGLALNAAVILDDPTKVLEMRTVVSDALNDAGFEMKVVDWQAASGIVGQFVLVIRLVLYVAIFIIFTVALVIINNSMVMAMMERVTEIGTMRAIGAQRMTVLAMVFMETLILGLAAGVVGVATSAGLITWLGRIGIAAPNPELTFLFGGPRLFPTVGLSNMALGIVIIMIVSFLSTLYPAFLALLIQPVMAMRAKE